MKNLKIKGPKGTNIRRYTFGKITRFTIPGVDEYNRDFEKLVANASNGKIKWIHPDFSV